MAEDSETLAKDDKEVEEKPQQDIESQINTAMRARIAHFKEQSEYAFSSLSLFRIVIFCCFFSFRSFFGEISDFSVGTTVQFEFLIYCSV